MNGGGEGRVIELMDIRTSLLFIGAALTISSVVPYLKDILAGKTKPNLVTWITWTLLTGIALTAELMAGEYTTAVIAAASMVATVSVVVVGILKKGYVHYSLFDILCQVSDLIGILLWFLFNSPIVAIVAVLAVDFVATLPTIRHSWIEPQEETWQTYMIGFGAAILGVFALNTYSWESALFPVYLVLINLLVAVVILSRRRKTAVQKAY